MTQESLDRNAHISDDEIRRDIADTRAEIAQMEREITGLELIGDRMSDFRAAARREGIRNRYKFIAQLRELLAARGAAS